MTTLHDASQAFVASLSRMSASTRYRYPLVLGRFLAAHPGLELDGLTPILLSAYVTNTPGAPKSAHQVRDILRSFCSWCVRSGLLPSNPAHAVGAPKVPARRRPKLTEDQLAHMLAGPAMRHSNPARVARDVAMMETFYGCGVRLAELCALDWGDVLPDGRLWVRSGKGDKERFIPLSRPARAALTAWQGCRYPDGCEPSGPLFTALAAHGRAVVGGRLEK